MAAARQRLEEAFQWASSTRPVPESWTLFTQQTFEMTAKTYTSALGTVLLARATDARVDPLSIKAKYGPDTYSLRTLGHEVIVPAARELGFSIRNTGREPLNNQPFFRYDHMSIVTRVRNRSEYDSFVAGLSSIRSADRDEALAALAAFLRVAISVAARLDEYAIDEGTLTVPSLVGVVRRLLDEGIDRPRKAQALVAAAFDVTHTDVRSRKINDPSRDYPGDVQAFDHGEPILAAEVRAKNVRSTEIQSFVSACRGANIERAFMIIFWPSYHPVSAGAIRRKALDDFGILLTIIDDIEALLIAVLGWSDLSLEAALRLFTMSVHNRLKEIEVADQTLAQWVELLRQFRSRAAR